MKSPAVRDVAGLDHTRHPRHRAQDATFRPMVLISLWQDRSSDPNERLASPGEFCEALIIDADEPDTITGSMRLDQPFALLKIQLIQVFDCAFQDQRETRRVKIKSRLAPRRVRLEHVITLAEGIRNCEG